MGLLDFFKKKTTNIHQPEQQTNTPPLNKNWRVLNVFEARLSEMGYSVKRHTQYLTLIVDDELEISFMIVENPGNHPSLMHLTVSASHPKYFQKGVIENVVGTGYSLENQANSALNNYINSTFLTIIESFSDRHNPNLDFTTTVNGKVVLWHPKLGSLCTQGQWNENPPDELFFDLLKDKIPDQLTSNKINWLKIYISKRANGEIIGECLFNNDPWEAASNEIFNYAKTWEMRGEFHGLKQFIMFRRCDASDI
ncbi:DUF6348 family protein [Mucilaginibacter sp. SP1R1]|uniref:DUF6348 family protein n=1 Tax=Mucilaginibacter sp. SP1R1 TaxID=2723091 RepID=UPI00161259E9|nr:DUF6348 family protein [Mucilaginibacter sp. SP1R1]MBB6151773.1 hypothetical protein [Mucilaginibacter sp. SP1R1]